MKHVDDGEKVLQDDLAEHFLSMQQAAELLAVADATVRRAVISGVLPHVILFGRKLIRRADLEEYRQRTQPTGEKRVGRPRKSKE